jgi:hypothetical protein
MSAATMSSSAASQSGGSYPSVLGEAKHMSSNLLLVGLVLISAYESRVPENWLAYFRSRLVQGLGLVAIFLVTSNYGWVHGILAALAYTLLVSRAIRTARPTTSGFIDYSGKLFSNGIDTTLIPQDNRWFLEKVLGENPYLIRERDVRTSAVQDDSEKSMTDSRNSK